MGDDRVKLMDHVVLLIFGERAANSTNIFRPSSEAVIWTCQTSGNLYDALPARVILFRSWNREGIENEERDMHLNKAPRIPVQQNRTQYPKQKGLILLVSARPKKIRSLVREEYLGGDEAGDDSSAICRTRHTSERYSWRGTWKRSRTHRTVHLKLIMRATTVPARSRPLTLEPILGTLFLERNMEEEQNASDGTSETHNAGYDSGVQV